MSREEDWPRIRLIRFNRYERPIYARITTKFGIVEVRWRDVAGDRCWFAQGSPTAKAEAIAAIEHVEAIGESMH